MAAYPDEPVLGLVLLGSLDVVIDEAEASGFASSKMRPELEHKDRARIFHLVQPSQFLLQFRLHTPIRGEIK